jgi:hypothetical protein
MIIKEVIGEVLLNPFHKLKGSSGLSLYNCTKEKALVVFVRHFGCIFCRQTLSTLSNIEQNIRAAGVNLIVVHQSDPMYGTFFLKKYGLDNILHFSDPDLHLFRTFGLNKGRMRQLLGKEVWKGGIKAVLKNKVIFGRSKGNVYQLGGFFLMEDGKINNSYICKHAADLPDIWKFISGYGTEGGNHIETA